MVDESRLEAKRGKRPRDSDRVWRLLLIPSAILAVVAFALIVHGAVVISMDNGRQSRVGAETWVDLDGPPDPATLTAYASARDADAASLRVAIAPVISPKKSLALYQGLAGYLGQALDRDAEILLRDTYAEISDLVRYRRCDIAFVCTCAFVEGQRDFGMEAIAIPVVDGEISYHSHIIVPQSSSAITLLDLRGKRFASADILSTSGWLYPAHWLKTRGHEASSFFSEHIVTGSHDRSVQAVASGYVDGAAVDSIVYEQLAQSDESICERTRMILESEPFGMPPIAVHPQVDAGLRRDVTEALLHMHEDAAGRAALARLQIDRFVIPDPRAYDGVRAMIDEVWGSAP